MNLRPAQLQDTHPCARLMAQLPLWQRYQVSEDQALHLFEEGLRRQANIIVAEIDGNLAGFIWYTPRGAFERSGYIRLIGVRADLHSQGVGQALMTHAEAQLFGEVDDIFLLVSDFNEAAHRFYRRHGYTQVGTIPDYVLPGISELIFRKHKPQESSQPFSGEAYGA